MNRLLLQFVPWTAAALLASPFTGCASSNALPELRTEKHAAGGVRIQTVRLTRGPEGLTIAGSVARAPGYFQTTQRHLDVEIVAHDGAVHQRVPTVFFPNPIPLSRRGPGHSDYVVTLPDIPPPGSTIRVTVHSEALVHCLP